MAVRQILGGRFRHRSVTAMTWKTVPAVCDDVEDGARRDGRVVL